MDGEIKRITGRLLTQVDSESETAAFWVVSAINKLATHEPSMTMEELRDHVNCNMPKAYRQYCKYLWVTD